MAKTPCLMLSSPPKIRILHSSRRPPLRGVSTLAHLSPSAQEDIQVTGLENYVDTVNMSARRQSGIGLQQSKLITDSFLAVWPSPLWFRAKSLFVMSGDAKVKRLRSKHMGFVRGPGGTFATKPVTEAGVARPTPRNRPT